MRRALVLVVLTAVGTVIAFGFGGSAGSNGSDGSWIASAARGHQHAATLTFRVAGGGSVTRTMPFVSNGTLIAAQQALCAASPIANCDERVSAADAGSGDPSVDSGAPGLGSHTLGCGARQSGHFQDRGGNVRVNQDCTYRRQAEEEILYNPADPNNLVAGQNDSRLGFNQCGTAFSTTDGRSWGDELPPFKSRLNDPESMGPSADNPNDNTIGGGSGTFHSYDAGSDPALAVDSSGRAYFSCVVFDILSNASGLYVTQSPRGAAGSFYFNVPTPPDKTFMVVEDNNGLAFHDKNFIAADSYRHSPNRDNVYVTWTVFKADDSSNYLQSPIFGSMSTDHGVTWSTPEDISGTSALCFFGDAYDSTLSADKCDFDQGSDPVVLPNGDLEVVFNNGNTPAANPNGQQLAVHCHPTGSSTTGTARLGCLSPAKVGDDVVKGEPLCDFGRGPEECIPGAYIRTNDYPRINTQNTQNNHLYATWQDYRNGEFDIEMSVSTDGGLTWHEAGTVNPERGLDHYMAADDQSPDRGDRVGVGYYRTERVPNESTTPAGGFAPGRQPGVQQGNSDYVLAGGTGPNVPYNYTRVSPVFPPPDGIQAGFNGDYSGLAINRGIEAHPIWSDTRNADPYAPANGVVRDEDIFTDTVNLPDGRGSRNDHGRVGDGR